MSNLVLDESTQDITLGLEEITRSVKSGKPMQDCEADLTCIEEQIEGLEFDNDELLQEEKQNDVSWLAHWEEYGMLEHDATINDMRNDGQSERFIKLYNTCYYLSCAKHYITDAIEDNNTDYLENALIHLDFLTAL